WIQVDLGRSHRVVAIATWGRRMQYDHYVTSYKIKHSVNADIWQEYSENGQEKIFPGNVDTATKVENIFTEPILARFVRLYP
ncbi:hypothetical protein CAPTEDRAFT_79577, partial [Capitella teleta]